DQDRQAQQRPPGFGRETTRALHGSLAADAAGFRKLHDAPRAVGIGGASASGTGMVLLTISSPRASACSHSSSVGVSRANLTKSVYLMKARIWQSSGFAGEASVRKACA